MILNRTKSFLVAVFIAFLAFGMITSSVSPLTVSAAGNVSASDTVSVSEISVPEVSAPEVSEADVIKTVTARRHAPDLLLSNQKRRKTGVSPRYFGFLPSAGYGGSYRSELNDNEKKFYDGLYQTFVVKRKNDTEVVHIDFNPGFSFDVVYSDADKDELSFDDLGDLEDAIISAAAAFFYDCPEAFWVRSFDYVVQADLTTGREQSKGYVTWVEFEFPQAAYPDAYHDLAAYDAGLASAVNTIRQTRANESVYETLKAIHDYVILNASYDYAALSGSEYTYGYAYTAAPLFTGKGTFVCEGYAKAFKILCQEFGIRCALVSGTGMTSASYGDAHMWNYVSIGGSWYGVDCTWDDGYTGQDGTPSPRYTYFLVGSTTEVKGSRRFEEDHINDGQVMSVSTKSPMVYPALSRTLYRRYITDTDPSITLTTLGASIRIDDPYGIRFGIQIKRDEAFRSVRAVTEYGTLLVASGTLGEGELTLHTPNVRRIKADNIYSQDETQITYTGVLTNIPQSFFAARVKGRGYLIYIDDAEGEEHIVYSETVEKSFYRVAQAAYASYSAVENPDDAQKATLQKLKSFLGNA